MSFARPCPRTSFDDAGIYAGTNTGQLFYSRDSGDTWELLADYLPPDLLGGGLCHRRLSSTTPDSRLRELPKDSDVGRLHAGPHSYIG